MAYFLDNFAIVISMAFHFVHTALHLLLTTKNFSFIEHKGRFQSSSLYYEFISIQAEILGHPSGLRNVEKL